MEKVELKLNADTGAINVFVRNEDFGTFDNIGADGKSYCYFPKKQDKLTGSDYIAIGEKLNLFNSMVSDGFGYHKSVYEKGKGVVTKTLPNQIETIVGYLNQVANNS